MENFIIIFCAYIFLILGCVGAVLPVLPGPLFSYAGLIIIYFFMPELDLLTQNWLIFYTVITIVVFLLDYLLQFLGVKKFGGGKKAVYGTTIGLLLGLFFLPGIGIIIGPFVGAFVGALLDNKKQDQALKIAFGSFLGFFFGTLVKLVYSLHLIYFVTISI